ncbi:hypothetical protein HB762_10240 [Vibrio campbellii]|uniref:YvrJ family protein n=1 Tax=Vibrio campbellii TaxID=680 RepID=A0ABY5IBQ8_9VIBR|nr:hypothetical protein [Vibrio campbellii]UTZ31745.1 hypothetical protein HB762_10240 [Vibrio campbellii]
MELVKLFELLTSMGLSPSAVAFIILIWKQDKRITIVETILKETSRG